MSLEPRVMVGYWTNGKEIVALYRTSTGQYKEVRNAQLPKPEDNILFPGENPILWDDLNVTNEQELRSIFKRLLDQVVVEDTKSTRRDDQLNQLCNLLLVKLESDKKGKVNPESPLIFQVWENQSATSIKIKEFFNNMKLTHGDLFCSISDQVINLDDKTINLVAYELGKIKLLDTTIDSLSTAFQVLRSESLKSEEGQYFTPTAIIKSCVKLMDISYDDKIIDPACGTGAFLLECFRQLKEKYPRLENSDAKTWAQQHLYGVDKDQINVKLTKAMLIILGDGSTHTFLGDSIRENLWATTWPYLVPALKKLYMYNY
ncbi:TPA: SAM-dependent DNA methyltransferase [Clostridioides difficile]|nr:N-6 DNA methylase [Clostridioides difficile]HCQ6371079.1 SAM-dependent DNA methyltransferase [Clostridioides difficile]